MTERLQKAMETRNFELNIAEAKRWYNLGGDLRKAALKIYTEDELNEYVPHSWEEYCQNAYGDFYYTNHGRIESYTLSNGLGGLAVEPAKELFQTKELAESMLALKQILILREAWVKGWVPPKNSSEKKFCITHNYGGVITTDSKVIDHKFEVNFFTTVTRVLSFPTKEMAEEFLYCFRGLIEKCRYLI